MMYELYRHKEEQPNCPEPGFAIHADDPADFDECPACDEPLEKTNETEVRETLPRLSNKHRAAQIRDLTDYERTVLLAMTMKSLSENWSTVRERLGIIREVIETGCETGLVGDIQQSARRLATQDRVKYKHPDGRVFRGLYEPLFDELDPGEGTMKKVAVYLTNDKTFTPTYWDDD